MRGVNRVTLVGRVGRDPELRNSGSAQWCTFSVATGKGRRDGDKWVEDVDWHKIKVFGAQAEPCARFLQKGALVALEGAIHYEGWTDKDGTRRSSPAIVADSVQFLSRPAQPRVSPHADEEIPEFHEERPAEIAEAK